MVALQALTKHMDAQAQSHPALKSVNVEQQRSLSFYAPKEIQTAPQTMRSFQAQWKQETHGRKQNKRGR